MPVSVTRKLRARGLRESSTPAEKVLWQHLRSRRLRGLRFKRQFPIGPYVADFYCHELKLIVELDGPVHDEALQTRHDENRDDNLAALGYKILRFSNSTLFTDLDALLERISEQIDNR